MTLTYPSLKAGVKKCNSLEDFSPKTFLGYYCFQI